MKIQASDITKVSEKGIILKDVTAATATGNWKIPKK